MLPALPPANRRHDLDWLRALAILALLFFHSAMPYVAEWQWHVKNAQTSNLLMELNFFLSRFRMALLFVIAGVASQLMLRRRGPSRFLRDRARRLLVPLVFGILVIVPPQIYFERVASGAFSGSFAAFWPRTLALLPYPQGDTSYHHLWFIFYLFLYSALIVPAVALVRTGRGAASLASLRAWLGRNGVHVLALPILTAYVLLIQRSRGLQNVVDDAAMFVVYFLFYVTGWLVGNDSSVWKRIMDGRRRALTAAFLALCIVNALRWNDVEPAPGYTPVRLAYLALLGANSWFWVMTVLGYGARWLNRAHPALDWVRDASYPFYALHQTVIVMIAFYVVRTQEGVIEKFLFTSFVSLGMTLVIYETLVRPHPAVRWLFGMAPLAQPVPSDAARHATGSAVTSGSIERALQAPG